MRKITVKKDNRVYTTFKCFKANAMELVKRYRALGYKVKIEVL